MSYASAHTIAFRVNLIQKIDWAPIYYIKFYLPIRMFSWYCGLLLVTVDGSFGCYYARYTWSPADRSLVLSLFLIFMAPRMAVESCT